MARTRTPSRSRKTARCARASLEASCTGVLDESPHRLSQGLARRPLTSPAEGLDPVGVQPDDGDVSLPAARPPGELVLGLSRLEPDDLEREIGDLADRDVVACGDVVDLVVT